MSDQDVLANNPAPATTPATAENPQAETTPSAPDLLAPQAAPATAPAPAATDMQVLEKRLADKDAHIKTLETENAELRANVADLQKQLDNVGNVTKMVEDLQNSKSLTQEDVAVIVNNALTQQQTQQQSQANWQSFVDAAIQTAGSREAANQQLNEFLTNENMTLAELQGLAQVKPNVALRAAGLQPVVAPQPTPTTGGGVVPNTQTGVKEYGFTEQEYLQRLRDAGVKV